MLKNLKPKLIVIVGPTTSHKTFLAINIANALNGEIINADAYQVYKDMPIGTNGPTKSELSQAKFHLNEIINLNESWDIFKFKNIFKKQAKEIIANNKTPILVGGSNLYVDCIIKNYDLIPIGRTNEFDSLTNDELYQELLKKDYESAIKIGSNNRKRLLRALEVFSYAKNPDAIRANKECEYDVLMIRCEYENRQALYDSINAKVDEMFKAGWIDEVKKLINKYPDFDLYNCNAFKALGYREIYDFLNGNQELNVDLIKQKIRRYAKRQLTWINNKFKPDLVFNQKNLSEILNQIHLWLKK